MTIYLYLIHLKTLIFKEQYVFNEAEINHKTVTKYACKTKKIFTKNLET